MSTISLVQVKILDSCRYGNKYALMHGTVERESGKSLGIRIPGYENPASSYGLWWFDTDEVEFIENTKSEEIIMMNQNENFMVAGVKFIDGTNTNKEYFYALFDEYCVGDLVVVQTGHHGLSLAEITSIDCSGKDRVKCSREIVTRVDMSSFYDRQEKRKALAQLKKDMDKKVKELQETALYELLAEKDPALAAMVEQYKSLTGVN